MCSRPAVSRITTSAPCFFASRTAAWQTATGSLLRAIGVDRDLELLAEHVQLVDGRRALQVGGDQAAACGRAA